jgi:cytochrome c biogenesis protein CcmG/thiol:disulfide interchange protein DsbE
MRRLLLIASVLAAVFVAQQGTAAEKRLWAKSFLNQKAPDLVVEHWLSKTPDTHGKFVLVDFWATMVWPVPQGHTGVE